MNRKLLLSVQKRWKAVGKYKHPNGDLLFINSGTLVITYLNIKMTLSTQYNYTPVPKSIPISEQKWSKTILSATVALTYNHVLYIREHIEGILMQITTFPVRDTNFEDCYTDNTINTIKENKKQCPSLLFAFFWLTNMWGKDFHNIIKTFK